MQKKEHGTWCRLAALAILTTRACGGGRKGTRRPSADSGALHWSDVMEGGALNRVEMCTGGRDYSLGRVRFEVSRRRPKEVGGTVPVESGQGLLICFCLSL